MAGQGKAGQASIGPYKYIELVDTFWFLANNRLEPTCLDMCVCVGHVFFCSQTA